MNEPRDLDFSAWEEKLRALRGEVSEDLGYRVRARVEGELAGGSKDERLPAVGWIIAGLAWLNLSLGVSQLAEWRPLMTVDDRVQNISKDNNSFPSSIHGDLQGYLEAWR